MVMMMDRAPLDRPCWPAGLLVPTQPQLIRDSAGRVNHHLDLVDLDIVTLELLIVNLGLAWSFHPENAIGVNDVEALKKLQFE